MKLWMRLVAIVVLVGGCDTTIDPVRKDTYSVYGYLASDADRQFIRVKPLDAPLRSDANRDLDVTVTLHNVDAGTAHPLRDSVIVFVDEGDSLVTHNFWTDANIFPETTYRVTVERDGEVVTTAKTTTPTKVPPTTLPGEGNCLTPFRVRFDNEPRGPIRLRGEFAYDGEHHRVPIDAGLQTPPDAAPYIEFVPEYDLLDARIPGKERIVVRFGPDLLPPRCLELESDTIRVRYVYASPNWHEFDVNPTEPTDFISYVENARVKNGQGFFGALHWGRVSVAVDTSDTLEVGGTGGLREGISGGPLP